ncbi:MAG: hypothetical protein CFE23_03400 [Flavobacterium sp. BFFFF1]|uniref:Gfo/Idh/MocA family oxidoreductase n=1 Tax=Flavobacterium sp. BFFFF1 TaxID=2015557 RepID=UPI000BDAE07D|nr:Gfo/Idh/MocA family oxidoreductase [Flavobacterium sp. BFFFF1]OYU81525.1 MAG: hypothetical protein CFE23_03400 [Flavobacterium sp. BFFFF1]
MKINLIIGAGQLGSRHLQGLLKIAAPQVVYVTDPSASALEVARQRAQEIDHPHQVHYIQDWETLPAEFDLVIVATGAAVRSKVTRQLLSNYNVKYLVLEKILFQDLASYAEIGSLINEKGTRVWVNHPRRMYKHYQKIKELIAETEENIVFHTTGSNWGLACSALHFIDLCVFLAGSKVNTIDMDWIDPTIHPSKRANCIELTGSVKGTLDNGTGFLVTSLDGDLGDITVTVFTNSNRWIIQEGRSPKVIRLSEAGSFKEEISYHDTDYQSDLTTKMAEDIFQSGNCILPTFQEASDSHIPFIKVALEKYNTLSGTDSLICPIT